MIPGIHMKPARARYINYQFAKYFELVGIVLILLLAVLLRLANLESNPGWYSDEGTVINIAQNLLMGRIQYLAINQSTLLAARLPLFPILLSGVFRMFGADINSLRYVTGSLGVISVGLVYLVVRRVQGKKRLPMALLAAAMLAIYPRAVLYSRWGFSYNLLTPLILLTCLGLFEYLNGKGSAWLGLAVVSVGIGSVSDLMILSLGLPIAIIIIYRQWQDLFWGLPLLGLAFGIYSALMLLNSPDAFIFDLRFTLSRLGAIPWFAQFPVLALNIGVLVSQDYWMIPGIIGLFLLKPRRWKYLCLLLFFFPLISLGRTAGIAGINYYYIVPLLPFVAIGMANLIWKGIPLVIDTVSTGFRIIFHRYGWMPADPRGQWFQSKLVILGNSIALFLIIISPFLISAFLTVDQIQRGFHTSIDFATINGNDARQVADFINSSATNGDLVIASPALAWAIRSNVSDFQQAIAAEGISTAHFPDNIPNDRFAFDPRFDQAKFVAVDPIWSNWAAFAIPEVALKMTDIEKWPLVYKRGDIEVFRNPAN
jgi:hypothetical protein